MLHTTGNRTLFDIFRFGGFTSKRKENKKQAPTSQDGSSIDMSNLYGKEILRFGYGDMRQEILITRRDQQCWNT